MKKQATLLLAASALAVGLTGVAASTAQAALPSAADCAILGPIGDNGIDTLLPLSIEQQPQKAHDTLAYIASLRVQAGKVGPSKGRDDLNAYANDLANSTSMADAPKIMTALTQLQNDCPS